jgi:hypothetical protein
MQIETVSRHIECDDTQLAAIRELMLAASTRGEWLTLAEIAEPTEFGEASISAQLRHLRKPRHGRYCVEKRRRRSQAEQAALATPSAARSCAGNGALWEYRVFTVK